MYSSDDNHNRNIQILTLICDHKSQQLKLGQKLHFTDHILSATTKKTLKLLQLTILEVCIEIDINYTRTIKSTQGRSVLYSAVSIQKPFKIKSILLSTTKGKVGLQNYFNCYTYVLPSNDCLMLVIEYRQK